MNEHPGELKSAELRIIEELIDEHVRVDCNLIQIDADTWAIHGSIAVDGQVIVAEFSTQRDAQVALERIVAAESGLRQPRNERNAMKVVVIGGTGLVGSKLVAKLGEGDHEAVAASPNSGVNTLTGEGLAEVLERASVVVDVSNSPSFEDAAVLEFFETSTRNLLQAEAAANVEHHVALSVVGTERLAGSGYFRAKIAQEKLIKGSSIPFSIVHATQFFEFVKSIADAATDGDEVRVAPVLIQPMSADDVATGVGKVAVGVPLNGVLEIAGPEQFRLDEFVRQGLSARNDPRQVLADPRAPYFGTELEARTLVPERDAELGATRFEDWLTHGA